MMWFLSQATTRSKSWRAVSSADVMIFKGKELVAKAAAQPEKLEGKADRNTVRFAVEGSKAPRSSSFDCQANPNLTNSATGTEVSQRAK